MTLLVLFVLFATGTLLLIFLAVWRRGHSATSFQLRPVDLLAFRNLIDPDEEEYLRKSLSPLQFNALQRERMRAAAGYIMATIHNSGVLLQLGQAAALNPDPNVVASARQLVQMAARLRGYAALALAKVYLRILVPSAPLSVERFAESYHHLHSLAGQVLRLERLPDKERLSAVL